MREYRVGDEPVPGYQITSHLGSGGYGTVWVAKSPGGVEIALKSIRFQGHALQEFRAVGLVKKLRHPNLIPIYAFWLKDEYGLGLGHARAIAYVIRHGAEFTVRYKTGPHRDVSGTLILDGSSSKGGRPSPESSSGRFRAGPKRRGARE